MPEGKSFKFTIDDPQPSPQELINSLCQRIYTAYNELLKHEIEANVVILNGKKYAKVLPETMPGCYPSIIGLKVELANLNDDWDFIVQQRIEPKTNGDKIREKKNYQLAAWISSITDRCPKGRRARTESCKYSGMGGEDFNCLDCWEDWLQKEIEHGD